MKQKKVIFVVPDGTGIRNYLFSQVIPNLHEQNIDLLVYHALSEQAITEVESVHGIELQKRFLSGYKETIWQKFLREAICYARLHHNARLEENPTVLTNWKRNHKGLKKWFYKVVEIVGRSIHGNYERILQYERKYQNSLKVTIDSEIEFLKAFAPDIIFCTHQRAVNAVPVFKAAEILGIRTVGAIYSWDNLVKARLAVRTTQYIVWSEYMKDELQRYYPEITENRIKITGTPQFELYDKAEIRSKEAFFDQHDLDIDKFTICFSGDDELTSPYDPKYLEDLINAVKASDIHNNIQIIFRRSPVDLSGRYDQILDVHRDIVVALEPKWSNTQKQWTQLFPYYEDVNLLANICKHSDLVINVGSTMAHDFAIFDNPAAYINYDAVKDNNWSVTTIYNYQHFKSMPQKEVVYWINSKNDYITVIHQAMKDNHSLAKEWLKIINDTELSSEQAITQLLTN